jgi:hypothetical protein
VVHAGHKVIVARRANVVSAVYEDHKVSAVHKVNAVHKVSRANQS